MLSHMRTYLAVLIFCAGGWVCNVSVVQADDPGTSDFTEGASAPLSERPIEAPAPTIESVTAVEPAPVEETTEPVEATIEPAADSAGEADVTTAEGGVEVTTFDTVSLNVQNTDLASVLQLLSIQGRRNIVPSPKVQGTVTANLYDVTFHEALEAILEQNGAGFVEKGNFIYVYTADELAEKEKANRKTESRIVKLNYITATDAVAFVSPMLSSAGSIAGSGAVGAGFQPSLSDGGANSFAHQETLVIRDYAENLDAIAKVIKNIDTRPQQVMIEATILQADLSEDLALGVDMAILADFGLGSFMGDALGTVGDMISGDIGESVSPAAAINSTVGNVAEGKGGLKVGIITNNVQIFIRALDEVTDTTVMANPKIMTLNRQRAEVLVGEKIAYLSTTATATATTQTVEFLDTGTQMSVRPFISADGMIRMELKPAISTAELRDAGGTILPDETTQELTTNVMVPDGQTVVLGGLFKEETTITRKQVPGLGDIPIAGHAFKGKDDTVRRSEVIFLITPHIIKDKAMVEAGAAAMDGIEQIRIGTREGLLPWSRSKFAAGHMRDALRAMEDGDKDKAMLEVDMALSLDPRMLEARRMKEKMSGERAYWPTRSLLDESIDLMVEQKTGKKPQRKTPVKPNGEPGHLKTVPLNGPAPRLSEADVEEAELEISGVDERFIKRGEVPQLDPDALADAEDDPTTEVDERFISESEEAVEPEAGIAEVETVTDGE